MKKERLLKFIKQIENNLMICPKETGGAGNRSEMGRGETEEACYTLISGEIYSKF